MLWYLRRRTVAYEPQLAGAAVVITGDDVLLSTQLASRLTQLNLQGRVDVLRNRATPFAAARMVSFLGAPRIVASDLLLSAGVRSLELVTPPVPVDSADAGLPTSFTETQVLAAAAPFGDPKLGDGLDRVLAAYGTPPMTAAQVTWLATGRSRGTRLTENQTMGGAFGWGGFAARRQ